MSTKRYRVLYVQRPNGGGSATGLQALLRCLDRDRFEPTVLCYSTNRHLERFSELGAELVVLDGGATTRPLPGPVRRMSTGLRNSRLLKGTSRLLRRDWPLGRRMAAAMIEAGADLVHHNDNPSGDRGSVIGAWMAGLPQVCHVRFLGNYLRPVDRMLSSRVSSYVYMSRAIERHCRNAIGVPAEKGTVLYDPFDFDAFVDATGQANGVRAQLGLSSEDRVVTNVGRLVPWKGQDVFIQAVAQLAQAHPQLKALVVGAPGDNSSGEWFTRKLRHMVLDMGLTDRVTFTGYRADIPAIMAVSDIIVHSATRPEPFGRVVVEAMAAGRPVVATWGGGVPEIVDDQLTGTLVPMGDPYRMAEEIDRLLCDPDRARSMGERGRIEARTRFTADRFAASLNRIYARALRPTTRRAEARLRGNTRAADSRQPTAR